MLNSALKVETSSLIMIDIQEKLITVMSNIESLIANNRILLSGAKELGVDIIISEQYPKGLGHTVEQLSEFVADAELLEKNHFSLYLAHKEKFDKLIESGKKQFVLSGTETHICVYQTAKDLLHAGAEVFMVSDAVSSRKDENRHQILDTLLHMGANVLPTEAVLFEWVCHTSNPAFKPISKLIK